MLGGTYGQPRVQWGRLGRVSSGHRLLAEGGWTQSGVESRSRLGEPSPTVAPKRGWGRMGGARNYSPQHHYSWPWVPEGRLWGEI